MRWLWGRGLFASPEKACYMVRLSSDMRKIKGGTSAMLGSGDHSFIVSRTVITSPLIRFYWSSPVYLIWGMTCSERERLCNRQVSRSFRRSMLLQTLPPLSPCRRYLFSLHPYQKRRVWCKFLPKGLRESVRTHYKVSHSDDSDVTAADKHRYDVAKTQQYPDAILGYWNCS